MKQHVFISYSRRNSDVADQLVKPLEAANIPIWIDRAGISHHTPSFEREIRQRIAEAFAFVLIASPESLESDYVQGEIDVALDRGIPIVVMWSAGEYYTDTVPSMLTRRNHIDARGARLPAGLERITDELRQLRDAAIPGIAPLDGNLPTCCFALDLPDRRKLAVRPDAFATFGDFLMALYTGHLSSVFPPFTYGKSWVIATGVGRYSRAAAPLDMLLHSDKRWYGATLGRVGLVPNVQATVQPMTQRSALFVLALDAKSVRALSELEEQAIIDKFALHYVQNGVRTEITPESLTDTSKRFYVLMADDARLGGKLVTM